MLDLGRPLPERRNPTQGSFPPLTRRHGVTIGRPAIALEDHPPRTLG